MLFFDTKVKSRAELLLQSFAFNVKHSPVFVRFGAEYLTGQFMVKAERDSVCAIIEVAAE